MKTELTKRQKDTVICFNEESDIIDVRTHNTDLRNRLSEFSLNLVLGKRVGKLNT